MDRPTDPATAYIGHVLEAKGWTMNELATKSGVAASTINRPMRGAGYRLSRTTIERIYNASKIDPSPYFHWAPTPLPKEPEVERDPGVRRLLLQEGAITIDATIAVHEVEAFCTRLKAIAGIP